MISMAVPNDQLFEVNHYPCMPGTLLKLIDLYSEVEINFNQIAETIQTDPALTSKVIALGNTVTDCKYNLLHEFDKLALVFSVDVLKTITVTAMIQQYFSQYSEQNNYYSALVWQSSIRCAYTARALARLVGYKNTAEAYQAGLLHRLGQLSLLANYETDYTRILDQSSSLNEQNVAELKLANLTSAQLTAELIQRWDKDSFIADAILYQHESTEAIEETSSLIKIVNLAVKMCADGMQHESVYADASQLFGLSETLVSQLLNEVTLDVEILSEQLGIHADKSCAKMAFNETCRSALGEKIRNIALVNSLHVPQLENGNEVKDSILHIMQDIGLLFDLRHCIWFDYSYGHKSILGYIGNKVLALRVQGFKLDIEKSQSLVVKSFTQRKPVSSYDLVNNNPLSIVDQQLTSLLQAEGIIAMPFVSGDVQLGVMVAGINQAGSLALQNNNLLSEFIHRTTRTLIKEQNIRHQQKKILEEQTAAEKLRIRKLVHEANNPLAIMRNYLQILSMKLANSDESVTRQLNILIKEVERVGNTISHIRDDIVSSDAESGQVDINVLINESLMIFEKSLFNTHQINYIMELDENLPAIQTSHNSIKQILTNLLKNSAEAMPDGGEIVLKTCDHINFNGIEYIELTISDNGPGIPEAIMQNIFEPVKSTKDETHSGLGLTIVKNLITNLGGSIRCKNQSNRGVEFNILLPRRIIKIGED